ncbi:MAG: hypothetical protein IPM22_17055 [Betaproteobacteria bacterium]|jgi:hypothetical protein|nr:hypothetical protein [Betaproteobacteria bacterium]MCC7216932.1 hypothetical protein [Burkholderiales bacterium]
MNNGEVILKVFQPTRGGPIEMIGPGDLAEPYGPSVWQRLVAFVRAAAEVGREARDLEARLAARGGCYRLRES